MTELGEMTTNLRKECKWFKTFIILYTQEKTMTFIITPLGGLKNSRKHTKNLITLQPV